MAPIPPTSGSAGSSAAAGSTAAAPQQVDKNMFLKLLVAQLRNQNPLSPTDSMQFVQQLAQYQQLEESVNSGQDIAAIRKDLDLLTAAQNTTES